MKGETEHTAGPWAVTRLPHVNGDLWLTIGHVMPDGHVWGPVADIENGHLKARYQPVAELEYLVAPEGEQWANARLIAAAPDLLAACQDIRDFLRRSGYDTRIMDAAIRKAKEGDPSVDHDFTWRGKVGVS